MTKLDISEIGNLNFSTRLEPMAVNLTIGNNFEIKMTYEQWQDLKILADKERELAEQGYAYDIMHESCDIIHELRNEMLRLSKENNESL